MYAIGSHQKQPVVKNDPWTSPAHQPEPQPPADPWSPPQANQEQCM